MGDWLTNEAVSNYVTFIAGIIVAAIGFLIRERIRKKRPSLVLVEKESETSLLDIAPQARQFLSVTYGDRPVTGFYQTTLSIFNTGEHPLQDIEVILNFEETEEYITLASQRPIESGSREVDFEVKPSVVTIRIPYLNPRKEYGDHEQLQLYSPEPIRRIYAMGGGSGWSVKYLDKVKYRADLESILESNTFVEAVIKTALKIAQGGLW